MYFLLYKSASCVEPSNQRACLYSRNNSSPLGAYRCHVCQMARYRLVVLGVRLLLLLLLLLVLGKPPRATFHTTIEDALEDPTRQEHDTEQPSIDLGCI